MASSYNGNWVYGDRVDSGYEHELFRKQLTESDIKSGLAGRSCRSRVDQLHAVAAGRGEDAAEGDGPGGGPVVGFRVLEEQGRVHAHWPGVEVFRDE